MVFPRSIARALPPLAVLLLVAGCGNSQLSRTFGLVRDTPDEFTVSTRAPLSMPPDFALRPPEPGLPRPQQQSERALAEAALVPDAALGGRQTGVTQGQAALLRDAGAGAPPNIRAQVDRETQESRADDTFVKQLLIWRKEDPNRAVVDPNAEAQRLRQNAAYGQSPVNGQSPVYEDKRNWFQRLFSGIF